MQSNQVLNIINSFFNSIEQTAYFNKKELLNLIRLMFIDELYEVKRDISLKNISDNDGLTDEFVKKINNVLECIKLNSCFVSSNELDYLPTIAHWYIPDTPEPEPEENEHIINSVLFSNGTINNHIHTSKGYIYNKILNI